MTRHAALNNVDHAHLKIRQERTAPLGDAVMSAPIFPHEFRHVQAYYPIVYSKSSETGQVRPVALFGLEEGSNLFLTEKGWDAAYIPLAVQIQPFLIGVVREGGEEHLEVHLDLDHPRVSETDGEPLFLEHGEQTDFLTEVSSNLAMVHEGETFIPTFSAMLTELELVEPFTLDVQLDDGTEGRLAGLYTIAEEKLYSLDEANLGRLQKSDMLMPIYMSVASLSQFRSLIERRNRLVQSK